MKSMKAVTAMLALSLAVTILSACSSKESNTSNEGNKQSSHASSQVELANGKFEPAIEMTTYGCIHPDFKFKNGESLENNVLRKWEEDNLGIKVKYTWAVSSANDACATKAKLDLSANNALPDVISTGDKTMIQNYIQTGRFIEVSEVFEQYASEDLKRIMSENADGWNIAANDGKRYGIPMFWDTIVEDPIPWVRKDWLDKLGLKEPETLEQFEQVLDAFTNNDPDGNGQADTTGIALAWKSPGSRGVFNRNFSDSSFVFGAYGMIPGTWIENAEGKLEYSSTRPEIKQGLAKLKEWVEKGYVDKDASMYESFKAAESVLAGKTGILTGPHWLNVWPLPDLKKNVPDAVMTPIQLPTGPDGKAGRYSAPDVLGAVLINKDFEHPEAVILYMNKMLDYYMKKPGSGLENGFAEGYDYATVDGEITYDDAKIPGGWVNVIKYNILMGGQPPQDPKLGLRTMLALNEKPEPQTAYEKAKVAEHGAPDLPKIFYPAEIVNRQPDSGIKDKFMGAPTETMQQSGDMLAKLEEEMFLKIIYGNEPVDAFEKFVESWNSSGGEAITKEVNEWYASTKQ